MPIWMDTMMMEGGSFQDRVLRGATEFVGARAYPTNIIWDLYGEWSDDINSYTDIATTKEERIRLGQPRNIGRDEYRRKNPEIDAKLFITGKVTTLKTGLSKFKAKRFLEDNDVFQYRVEEELIENYKNVLGTRYIENLMAKYGKEDSKDRSTKSVSPSFYPTIPDEPMPYKDPIESSPAFRYEDYPVPVGR